MSALSHQLKVVGVIVLLIPVPVVDNLFWLQEPANPLFYHQSVLKDVALAVGVRVVGRQDGDVFTASTVVDPAYESGMGRPSDVQTAPLVEAVVGAKPLRSASGVGNVGTATVGTCSVGLCPIVRVE